MIAVMYGVVSTPYKAVDNSISTAVTSFTNQNEIKD